MGVNGSRLRRNFRVVILWATLALTGCSGDGSEDSIRNGDRLGGESFDAEVPSGVLTTLLMYEAEESLRFTLEAAGGITKAYPFLSDERGHYLVPDPFNHRLVAFNSSGGFVSEIGRQGMGPGEFQFPTLLGMFEGMFLVFDTRILRTTIVSTDGRVRSFLTVPAAASVGLEGILPTSDSNSALAFRRTRVASKGVGFKRVEALSVSATGEIRALHVTPPVQEEYEIPATPGFSSSVYGIPIGPAATWAFESGHGFVVGAGSEPRLFYYDSNGLFIRELELQFNDSRITAAEEEEVLSVLDRRIAAAPPGIRQQLEREKEHVLFPETRGYWDKILLDDRGFLWLRVPESRQARMRLGGSLFRIANLDGEYFGESRWPVVDGVVQGSRLLGLTSDETGEILPVVFHLSGTLYPFSR